MADVSKLKIIFTTNKENYDGFIPLNNASSGRKNVYIAYKYKNNTFLSNKIWFFTCNLEKKECTEFGKGATFPNNFVVSTYGWSNEEIVFLFMRSNIQDGITGLKFNIKLAGDKEVIPDVTTFNELQNGQINNIEFSSNSFSVIMKKKESGSSEPSIKNYNYTINKDTLDLTKKVHPLDQKLELTKSNLNVFESKI